MFTSTEYNLCDVQVDIRDRRNGHWLCRVI